MDEWHVAAGALTGFVVGMTGVGGGALMTPILVLALGTAPLTAVGTDLWFAAITKMAVSGLHIRQGLIDWPVVRRMWLGSLPASALTVHWMSDRQMDPAGVAFVTSAIAIAVCATAVSVIYAGTTRGNDRAPAITTRRHKEQTFARRLWASVARTPAMHASVGALRRPRAPRHRTRRRRPAPRSAGGLHSRRSHRRRHLVSRAAWRVANGARRGTAGDRRHHAGRRDVTRVVETMERCHPR